MKEIMSWYNNNKKKIWTTITIVIVIIVVIQVLNSLATQNLRSKQANAGNTAKKEIATNTIILEREESAISGVSLTSEQTRMLVTLDEFGKYCTNGEVDKAYDLLSDECKEELYNTKELFEKGYYEYIFKDGKKDISVENWVGNTYKVRFIEDALSTGTYDLGSALQDFITIVKDANGENKLNINGYIERKKLNSYGSTKGVEIKAVETNVYMDYQTFTFEITNNSDITIKLYEPNMVDSMYLEDSKGVKYSPYSHELSQADLKIAPYETRILTIKFYSRFVSTKQLENIVFNNIILDNNEYQSLGSKYINYGNINISL